MFGKILKVNLSTGDIWNDVIPPDWVKEYIGGSSLGVRILWDYLRLDLDPLHPDNPLLWICGPLTGTGGPTTGRSTICGRSPKTGLWGEANIGGFVGSELRYAGYDAVLIIGKAPRPVYIMIRDNQVRIISAEHLWGVTDTYQTQEQIRKEQEDSRLKVASIGLAGENLVQLAGILSDHGRIAARTGMGALMGSKNLKAVAVRGSYKTEYVQEDLYKTLRVSANKDLLQQNITTVFRATGTSGAADYFQLLGDMPQKYWTAASFENATKVGGAEMAETILTGVSACQGCVVSCGRVVSVTDGLYPTDGDVKGPEYETIVSFGPQLLVDDLAVITALNGLCDRYGLDTISVGGILGLAYLMYERGYLQKADTHGLELRWGDASPCFPLIDQIARKQGLGEIMALGSKTFARTFGAEDLAVEINGLEVPTHDPRALTGMALVYVTSPRGACHNQSDFFEVEIGGAIDELGIPMTERFECSGKAQYVARHQYWRTITNSLVYCIFGQVNPKTILALTNAALGFDWKLSDLLRCGERAWNLKRIYNLQAGLDIKREKLPRILLVSLPEGGQEGHIPDLDQMLEEYYQVCGWDRATGYPTDKKIEELNLGFTQKQDRQ
jgi:aldehyde:ferredoxin oxidoreductase